MTGPWPFPHQMFAPRYMLHMVSNTRVISESADGEIQAQAAFLLMQTLVEGPTTLHLAGTYYDRYTRQDGVLKLKERQVVYDTTILANDLVYPSRPVPPRQEKGASRRNLSPRTDRPASPAGFVPRQHGGVLLPHVEKIGLVRADGGRPRSPTPPAGESRTAWRPPRWPARSRW